MQWYNTFDMTLILNCLTNSYAIQVSDRRLSLQDGSLIDDLNTKAILVNGNMIFGYTGLANIGKKMQKADDWFLESLSIVYKKKPDANLTEVSEALAKLATENVAHVNVDPSCKRLAFVGVGWCKLTGTQDFIPCYVIISNAHDSNGKWLPNAKPEFNASFYTMKDGQNVMLIDDGQQINRQAKIKLKRILRNCANKGVGPKTMAQILVSAARKLASQNQLVSRSLLVNCIPKISVKPGNLLVIGSAPRSNMTTFSYIPDNTSKQIAYGPHIFANGTVIKDWIVKQGK